jgi:pilus assembly protein CpaE
VNGNGNGHSGGDKAPIRLLIADNDQDHRNLVKNILTNQSDFDVVASVGDGERAARLAAQLQPDVVILEFGMSRSDGSDATESIALASPYSQIILLAKQDEPDLSRKAMLAGARDYLIKPVEDDDLVRAVLRVYNFAAKRQAVATDDTARPVERTQNGQVYTVWGPKGGVGRTFMAVNLAVAMATSAHKHVLLMDGCLGFCTADVALDISSKMTILDLVVDNDEDLDVELIERVIVHHASGIDVLLAPAVENMLSLAPVHIQRILTVMRRLYDCIVVDTRPLLDDTTVAFLDLSDVIVTICTPDIASLRNLRIFLDAAHRLGYGQEKIRLVINRHDMRGAITHDEIEKVCHFKILSTISNDHEAVANSINRGQPLVTMQPQRPISHELTALARTLTGYDEATTAGKAQKSAIARFFGRNNQR